MHPTGLHGDEHRRWQHQSNTSGNLSSTTPVDHGEGVATVTTCRTDTRDDSMTMSIVKVILSNDMDPQQKIRVYAALDGMSTASFVSKDVWMRLGSPGDPTKISIRTLTYEHQQSTVVVNNLSITSVHGDKHIRLPKVHTQDHTKMCCHLI